MREEPDYPAKRDVAAAFGAVLQRRRKAHGLTQEEVAEAGGISPKYVSLMERGRHAPSLHTVIWMAQALGAEPMELVAEAFAALRSPSKRRTPSQS